MDELLLPLLFSTVANSCLAINDVLTGTMFAPVIKTDFKFPSSKYPSKSG